MEPSRRHRGKKRSAFKAADAAELKAVKEELSEKRKRVAELEALVEAQNRPLPEFVGVDENGNPVPFAKLPLWEKEFETRLARLPKNADKYNWHRGHVETTEDVVFDMNPRRASRGSPLASTNFERD